MNKSWVSGGKSVELADRLRREIADLEGTRDALVESNKKAVFEWGSFLLNSMNAPRDVDSMRSHAATQEVRDVLARYEQLNQQIMDKQALLNEKLDEQTRFDSMA